MYPRNTKMHTKELNNALLNTENFVRLMLKQVSENGNKQKIKIAKTIAATPPNLSGIALSIA